MTVAELIEKLCFFDPDLPVFHHEYDGWHNAMEEIGVVRLTDPIDWESCDRHEQTLGVFIR